ncbi:MAG: hypothetical protein A2137_04635 [Chloroflexi bacterium RBG_16_58_8]|nr:MAG: hypothetical protein A2137_04635 [Chloroflexi bacterium RBG_16_58_8]
MGKEKWLAVIIVAVGIVAGISGLFLFSGEEATRATLPEKVDKITTDIGITYLPVTPGIADYYRLGVNYGALVTQVVAGSPADLGGVQTGDVILSFNGARIEGQPPLLSMMLACPPGNNVTLGVWRQQQTRTIEFFHR